MPEVFRQIYMIILWLYQVLWYKMIKNISMSIMTVDNKYYDYDQNVILICSLRINCHVWGVPRPCRRCLDRFTWLFYYFIRFYDAKWMSMSFMTVENKHYDYNQNVILMCSLRANCHVWGVPRPCRRCFVFRQVYMIILSFYQVLWCQMIKNISISFMTVENKHYDYNQKCDSHVFITG